jgi:hypothetical protein
MRYLLEGVFHGTAAAVPFRRFDPATTAKGNDELGSGFYFTDTPETAHGHAMRAKMDRPGSESFIYTANLTFEKPLIINGMGPVQFDADVGKIVGLVQHSPNIHLDEGNPIENWEPTARTKLGRNIQVDRIIKKAGSRFDLNAVELDWFAGHSHLYRTLIRAFFEWDSVICSYNNGESVNFAAWFPEQITITGVKDGNGKEIRQA